MYRLSGFLLLLLLGHDLLRYLGGDRLSDVDGVWRRCRCRRPFLSFLRPLVRYHISTELSLSVAAIVLSSLQLVGAYLDGGCYTNCCSRLMPSFTMCAVSLFSGASVSWRLRCLSAAARQIIMSMIDSASCTLLYRYFALILRYASASSKPHSCCAAWAKISMMTRPFILL